MHDICKISLSTFKLNYFIKVDTVTEKYTQRVTAALAIKEKEVMAT